MRPSRPINLQPSGYLTTTQAKVWLCRLRSVHRPFERLGLIVSREVCLYIGIHALLPVISGYLLRLLDLETGACLDITLKQRFTTGTVFGLLPNQAIIAVGGSFGSSAVYAIALQSYLVSPLAQLLRPRSRPGLQVYGRSTYLFGGRDGAALTSCESLQRVGAAWRTETDMHSPKAEFWPCEYAGEIYLCAPSENGDCLEAYAVRTKVMRTFPGLVTCLSTSSIACFYAGEMLVLPSDGSLLRLQLPSMTIRAGTVGFLADFKASSSTPPVRVGTRIYWVSPDNGAVQVLDAVSRAKQVLGSS